MRLAIIFLYIIFLSVASLGQSIMAVPEFVVADSNYMKAPTNISSKMKYFVNKLDSVLLFNKGRVNILHIGGSHVQADFYTNVIRMNIDSLNGSLKSPRGFIFPYTVAKTNNPYNYKVKYEGEWASARNALKQFYPPQGLSGINVSTSDSNAWFSVKLNITKEKRWATDCIHLLGKSFNGKTVPILAINDSVKVESILESTGYRFDLSNQIDSFAISLQMCQPDTFVVTGLYLDNKESGIVYNTVGVNGASVPSYLGCIDFERDLQLIKPDLCVFAIGINDAADQNFNDSIFFENYNLLINRILNVSPNCAFIFITNNDSYKRIHRRYYNNPNGEIARQVFYKLATKWQGIVWDLYEIMGGEKSMQKWQNVGLAARDKIHFTRDGYEIVGKLFYDAFLNFYLDYDTNTDPYDY